MGGFCGRQEEMDQLIRPKVQEWAETTNTLFRFAVRYPQMVYSGLMVLLQAGWQYLMWNNQGVGEYMGPVKEALSNTFLPKLLVPEII